MEMLKKMVNWVVAKVKANLSLIAVLLGVAAFLMFFTPVAYLKGEEDTGTVTGILGADAAFGMKLEGEAMLKFSFLNFVTFLLPLAGAVLLALAVSNNNKLFSLISAGCFALATICFFLVPSFLVYSEMFEEMMDMMEYKAVCGGSVIIGALFNLAAAACAYFSGAECEAVAAPVEEVATEEVAE